jgi:hypothetical protein
MIQLSGAYPAPGENLISPDTDINFTLVDDGSGIDISTLIVLFSGDRILEGTTFKDGFDGPGSSVTPSGSDYIISIDPETDLDIGKVYEVKIQVKDLNGKYFNTSYSFKTLPAEPILVQSSPTNNDVLKFPQILYLEFEDILDGIDPNSITISINGLNYIENGIPDANYNGGFSDITLDGTKAIVRVDPSEPLRNGTYTLQYIVSDSPVSPTPAATLTGSFSFSVAKKEEVLPTYFPQIDFLGFFQGIKRVSNLGNGNSLSIEWNKPIRRSYQNHAYILVYENPLRLNVFDTPTYIATTDILEATVSGFQTGKTLSFGARAFELPNDVLDPNGMEMIQEGFYRLPQQVEVFSTVSPESLMITATSTEGYPDAGILLIGREAIRYNSVDRINNIFYVPPNGRGLLNSSPGLYVAGDAIKLFLECTDKNTVILMSTPTYHDDGYNDRFVKGIGVVVTDYNDNDRNVFDRFDYCGWRSNRPQDTLYGKNDCGTYMGGEYNGLRGFNVYDRMLAQEEILIETTGEPVVLLRRIWDGVNCSCLNNRKMSPKVKSCQSCYGTAYEGGYMQYIYPRRNDTRILVSFKEAAEDLKLGEKEHLQQEFEPGAWTLAQPTIRDRDLLVRFDFTNDIEFIYEVLAVSRSKNFNRRFGRQDLTLKRLDKTDIVYTYPIDLSKINFPS